MWLDTLQKPLNSHPDISLFCCIGPSRWDQYLMNQQPCYPWINVNKYPSPTPSISQVDPGQIPHSNNYWSVLAHNLLSTCIAGLAWNDLILRWMLAKCVKSVYVIYTLIITIIIMMLHDLFLPLLTLQLLHLLPQLALDLTIGYQHSTIILIHANSYDGYKILTRIQLHLW